MIKPMSELGLGIVYVVKFQGFNKKAIVDYIVDFTGMPENYVNDRVVDKIIRSGFCEYIACHTRPDLVMANFFDFKERRQIFKELYPQTYKKTDFEDEEIEAIISIFQSTKMKDENSDFSNGFEPKEKVFKGFPNAQELTIKHFGKE